MIKKLLNTDANSDNLLKLTKSDSGCCGDGPLTPCKSSIVGAAGAFKQFIVKDLTGANVTFTTADLTDAGDIAAFINTKLATLGFTNVSDEYRSIEVGAPNNSIDVIGEVELVSALYGSTTKTATQYCIPVAVCEYNFFTEFDTDPGKVSTNGSGGTQIGTTGGFAEGAGATYKTAIDTALGTEAISFELVTVTEDVVGGGFNVTVKKVNGPFFINAIEIPNCNCIPDFTTA